MNDFKLDNEPKIKSGFQIPENYLAYHASLSDEEIIKLLDKEDIAEIEVTNSLDEEALKQALNEDSNIEYYITN